MAVELNGKIVLITGASSGIGAEMARSFAEAGAIPVLAARSIHKLELVAADIGGPHMVVQMDVTLSESVEQAVQSIVQQHGRIDVLINNAGYGTFKRFMDTELQEFADVMDVNYLGIVRCTQSVLPVMLKQGSGHIVNIASMAGKIGSPKSTAYSATKHAVLGFTNSLRMELAGTGVHVSAVNPGPITTPFFEKADPSGDYLRSLPSWFVLQPEQVADTVIRVVRKQRRERDIPWTAGFAVRMLHLFPGLFNSVALRLLNRK